MAEAVTFTGLGSGIDLKSIVDAMVETEKLRYVQPLEDWKSHWTEMSTAFSTLDTKLASFHSTVKSMDTPSEFLVNTATSSDSGVATASSTSGAVEGSYEIEVFALAQADKQIHSGFADADTTALISGADAVFSYTYDGTTIEIDVTDGQTTLTDLADDINSDPSNPGVIASVLDDGLGDLNTSFHLILAGETTGSDYEITINTDATDPLTGFLAANFDNSTHMAQDAEITIDGYPTGGTYITRSSNTISDVISDVTLNLTGADAAGVSATITISTDTAAIKENITTFIDEFNEIREYIKEQTSYNTDTNEAGILLGNYGADIVKNNLNEIMSSTATAFRDEYDTFINLMQIGIYTDASDGSETQGQLVIDEAVLSEALADNPQAVADLFADYYSGRSAHSDIVFDSYVPTITEAGTYEIYFNSSDRNLDGGVQMRISGGEWHDAEWVEGAQTITGLEGPEAGLVVKITDPGSTISKSNPGEIDLKLGILGTLTEELDSLTNTNTGPMSVLEENYQDIIDSIDEKIEREEDRISLYQQRLEERYARLEALLTELNGQSSMLENQINQLGN